jgi:hypothetical protein
VVFSAFSVHLCLQNFNMMIFKFLALFALIALSMGANHAAVELPPCLDACSDEVAACNSDACEDCTAVSLADAYATPSQECYGIAEFSELYVCGIVACADVLSSGSGSALIDDATTTDAPAGKDSAALATVGVVTFAAFATALL